MKRSGTYIATYSAHYHDSLWAHCGPGNAFDLNMGALVHCNTYLTDGIITREDALTACPWMTPEASDQAIKFLLAKGLWKSVRRGVYQIMDYTEHALEASAIDKRADSDYNRQVRHREHLKGNHAYCPECAFTRKAHRAGDHSECKTGICSQATKAVAVARRPGSAVGAPVEAVEARARVKKVKPAPEEFDWSEIPPRWSLDQWKAYEELDLTEFDWTLDEKKWSPVQKTAFRREDELYGNAEYEWVRESEWAEYVEWAYHGEADDEYFENLDSLQDAQMDAGWRSAWFRDRYPAFKEDQRKRGVPSELIDRMEADLLIGVEGAKERLAEAQETAET